MKNALIFKKIFYSSSPQQQLAYQDQVGFTRNAAQMEESFSSLLESSKAWSFLSCFAYKFDFVTRSSKSSFAMKLLRQSNGLFVIRSDKLEVGVVGNSLQNVRANCQHGLSFLNFLGRQFYYCCNFHLHCSQFLIPLLIQTMHLQHSIVLQSHY